MLGIFVKQLNLDFFKTSENWNKAWDFLKDIGDKQSDYYYKLEPCFIRSQGKIVSGCLLFTIDRVVILFHLYTKLNYRKRGFAKKVIELAIKKFRKSEGDCVLLAGVKKDTYVYDLFRSLDFQDLSFAKNKKNLIVCYGR